MSGGGGKNGNRKKLDKPMEMKAPAAASFPTQIGNIKISQIDGTTVNNNKTQKGAISNQIQITPTMDSKQNYQPLPVQQHQPQPIQQPIIQASREQPQPPQPIQQHNNNNINKCMQYSKIARKRNNGVCSNARSPHTVAIIDRNQRHVSSGSIISERFVLTRAPSLFEMFETDVEWNFLLVRIGNQPDRKIIRDIACPDYDSKTLRHHVMLLELEKALFFTSGLLPACLANEATENLYDTLLQTGYTGSNKRYFEEITDNDFYESVENRIVSSEDCNLIIWGSGKAYRKVNPEDLCTKLESDVSFSWAGIVGGPLQTVNTRSCMFTVVAVTRLIYPPRSWELWGRFVNVYSRVTKYLDWIESVVWGNETVPVDSGTEGTGEAPEEDDPNNYFLPVGYSGYKTMIFIG